MIGLIATALHACGATVLSQRGYELTLWQTEDGLPQNSVIAITQTHDGYLWVGTYGGLARFDGEHFDTFDPVTTPSLPDGRIVSLFEDKKGVLWIGHDSGRITRYEHGIFSEVPQERPEEGGKVYALESDAAGRVWAVHDRGNLESLSDGRVVRPPPQQPTPQKLSVTCDLAGTVWVVEEGNAYRLDGTQLQPVDFGQAYRTGFVMGIAAASDGGIWLVRDLRVRKWRNGSWTADYGECPWGDSSVSAALELQDHTLAVGTMDQGVYIVFPDGHSIHFDHTNGLPQNWVRCLYEDREGTLWVGAGTGGMAAIHTSPFEVLNSPDQWQGRTVLSVAPGPDGALWVGTEGSGLYLNRAGSWQHFGEIEGFRNLFIWAVAQGPDGRGWAGTWSSGIYRQNDDRFDQAPEFGPGSVFALLAPPESHTVWAGTSSGLWRWENGAADLVFQNRSANGSNVCAIAQDRNGVIWFGVTDGGLGMLNNGQVTLFTKRGGLSSDSVQSLYSDTDDTLWIGTADGGLNRYKNGKFSMIGAQQGLPSNVICHIADDRLGHLWLSTHHGLVRVSKAELNRCADGQTPTVDCHVYDRTDGLPTIEFSGGLQAAGCQTRDGRLWFTSSKGLVSVDPAKVRPNPLAPPVAIESMQVDGRSLNLQNGPPAALSLPPEHRRIEFRYTGLSFAAPTKVHFKHRLQGLDTAWVDAGTQRTAVYSHLPAGNYQLQVIAANEDNVWNNAGATLNFSVEPYFWQRRWFVALSTVFALGLVAVVVRAITRRRLQRRLAEVERERAIERERARIAQDIHDDLGASLTRITMLTQSASQEGQGLDQTAVLESIRGTARELTRSLDEIVWAIDPQHDTLDSLVCYMGKYAQDFLSAAGVRCRLDLPVDLPSWPLTAQTRHHLFLAFKEALNNTIKHAAATEVRLSLALETNGFVLTIKDNGRGLSEARENGAQSDRYVSGHGLENLQLRLAQIGGSCEIASEPGNGTRVSFRVAMNDLAPPPTGSA